MTWPDNRPPKKQRGGWRAAGLLVALAISVFIAGRLNGWWRTGAAAEPATTQAGIITPDLPVLASPQPAESVQILRPTIAALAEAPPFSLPDLFDANTTIHLDDFAGQPLLLNFWATWCVPCRAEMPALEATYQSYKEQGLVILGVNQTYTDNLEAAQAFVTDLGLTFPNVADETGAVSEDSYWVFGLPTTVFITPEGQIAHVQIGEMSPTQMDRFARQLIAGEEIVP